MFMLPRAEETSYILRMVVIFKLSRAFLDKYLGNLSPWLISLVYKRILFALHKSYYVDWTNSNMEGFSFSRFIFTLSMS